MFIKNITIENFRIHKSFSFSPQKEAILITGKNGVGKTSVLEAISMLSPGKGMMGAEMAQQCRQEEMCGTMQIQQIQQTKQAQQINGTKEAGEKEEPDASPPKRAKGHNNYRITASLDNIINVQIESKPRGSGLEKVIHIEEKKCKSQIELLNWCDVIWFSARQQYDLDKPQHRRNLIDRLTFHQNPSHATTTKEYESLTKSRMQLLRKGGCDPKFLSAVEEQMATKGAQIAKERVLTMEMLNRISTQQPSYKGVNGAKCFFSIQNPVEEMMQATNSASLVQELISTELAKRREKDLASEQTTFGTHKAKVNIQNELGINFSDLSSGQQKLLFLFMTKVLCNSLQESKGRKPIILLDEIISFLDEKNISIILSDLQEMAGQIWMTSPVQTPLHQGVEHLHMEGQKA